MNETIHIAIIEDNRTFTGSLLRMIQFSDGLNCAASFDSAEECLDRFEDEALHADVILLDLHLPGRNGLTLVPFLQNKTPEADILVLTQDDNYLTTLEAIKLGVSGYILKDAAITDIRDAIFEVHAGACIIDAQLSRVVLQALSAPDFPLPNPLNAGEKEVLELLAMGYLKKEVAERMHLSTRSVSKKTERIYKKLQVSNIAAAVATAIRRGMI